MYDYSGLTVLVTGASRGIGTELAREAALRGAAHIVLVARAEDELRQLAGELEAKFATAVTVLALDLTDTNAAPRVKAETDRRNLTIDILVNNAGIGGYGFFDEIAVEKSEQMITLNVAALVALTGLYLPGIIARDRGGILNVSSTAAFQPVAFTATYGATKAFVQSFTEAIWAENQDRANNVHITALCPGATTSHFGDNLGDANRKFDRIPHMSAVEVAKIGWDGWERNTPFIVAGLANYLGTFGARLFPRSAVARVSASLFRPADAPPRKRREINPQTVAVGAVALGALVLGARALRKHRS